MTEHATGERANLRAELLDRFVPQAAKKILDAACGAGVLGARLKQRPGVSVCGLDPDPACATAARAVLDEAHAVDLNREPPPYPEAVFDCVVADTLLERLRNPETVLKRLAALLRPGGVFVAAAANQQHHRNVIALAEGQWLPAGAEDIPPPGPIRFYTAQELVRLVRGAGLTVRFCAALERDPVEALPLDESGMAHAGRIDIGPLSPSEHIAWLTRRYVLLAMRDSVAEDGPK